MVKNDIIIKQNNNRKTKVKAAMVKVNKNHGKTLKKLGEGVDDEFIAQVDAFIEQYRTALKRLAKK